MSGLSRTPGKRVRVNSPPRVRIPPSPPENAKGPQSRAFSVLERQAPASQSIATQRTRTRTQPGWEQVLEHLAHDVNLFQRGAFAVRAGEKSHELTANEPERLD